MQMLIIMPPKESLGLPWRLSGKESSCPCSDCRFHPRVGKIPWRRKWQPTPVFLPGKSLGQRSLAGCSPWGHKEQDTTWRLNSNNRKESLARLFQTKASIKESQSPISLRTCCCTESLAGSSPGEVEPWCKHYGFCPISKDNQMLFLFSSPEFYLGAISSISINRTWTILTTVDFSMVLFNLSNPIFRLSLVGFDFWTAPPLVKYTTLLGHHTLPQD